MSAARSATSKGYRESKPSRFSVISMRGSRLATTRARWALHGAELGEFWKYRVGDYRVIASIRDETVTIIVVKVGNRRDVYRRWRSHAGAMKGCEIS